jgi:hypothetical protein
MLLVYGVTALIWWGFIQQIILGLPWGNKPAPDWMMWIIWLIFGIGFPVVFNLMRLIVEIYDDRVDIRFAPIHSRKIPSINIVAVDARNYSAIKEYGGWGIRGFSSSRKMAYNIRGNEGVELTLRDGRLVLIGSQQADNLAEAIINSMGEFGLKPEN